MSDQVFKKYLKLLGSLVGVFAVGFLIFALITSGTTVVNPADNTLDIDPEAGKSYALLYNQGKLYENIRNSEDNLRTIQEDLALFVRTTRPEFSSPDELVGFTFEKGFDQTDNVYTHHGYYYGLKDKIRLTVTVLDRGVITLSITNTKDNTNIDSALQLNGLVNKLITKLPVEEDYYTIRYFNSQDEITVGFFLGYSLSDVEAVEKILTENLDEEYKTANISYTINSRGIFTLDEIKEFANSPENTF